MTNPQGGRPMIARAFFCKTCKAQTSKRLSGLCHNCDAKKNKVIRPPGFVMTKEISRDIEKNRREIEDMRNAGILYKWVDGDKAGEVYR